MTHESVHCLFSVFQTLYLGKTPLLLCKTSLLLSVQIHLYFSWLQLIVKRFYVLWMSMFPDFAWVRLSCHISCTFSSFLCILLQFFPEVSSKYLLLASLFSCWSSACLLLPLICLPSFLSWLIFDNLKHPDGSKPKTLCFISLLCHCGFLDHRLISAVKILVILLTSEFQVSDKKWLNDSFSAVPSWTSRISTLHEITAFFKLFHYFFLGLLILTYLCVIKNVINMTHCSNQENNIFVTLFLLNWVSVSLYISHIFS